MKELSFALLMVLLLWFSVNGNEKRGGLFGSNKFLGITTSLFNTDSMRPVRQTLETKLPVDNHSRTKPSQVLKKFDECDLDGSYSIRIIAPMNEDADKLLLNLRREFPSTDDCCRLDNIINTAIAKGTAKIKQVNSLEEAFALKHRLKSCGAKAVIIDDGSNHEVFRMPKPEAVRDKIEHAGHYEVMLHWPSPEERDTVVGTMIRYFSGTEMTIEEVADLVDRIPMHGSVCIAEAKSMEEAMNIVEWLLDRKTACSVEYIGAHHQRHNEVPGVFPVVRHSPHYTPDDYFW